MFIATCLVILLFSVGILFVTFVIWLAHTLEGYPVFIISHTKRDAVRPPRPLFVPGGSAILDTAANGRSTRARPELWTTSAAIARAYDTAKRNKTAAI
jgi:hypothetical protein